ncbi:hypothetical protein Hypma_004806 [Hypsizygus marmoreus]|uniref:Uncharacterized protein n=1 Tax=Hypsizygus marmoreus TaxID=39966 RepID=A0A369J3N6_HYPMA|nr:hypothetical protein Hypma_004806 [Hypsizygus marmoreus]
MLSNIEQAVVDLLNAKQSITVANVFAAYMRIAGHDLSDTEKAVVTFERAMDKHALRPDVVQSPMIAKLRNQYWYTKLGGCKDGDGECHMCEHCGGMKLKDNKHGRNANTASNEVEASVTPPQIHQRPKRGKTKKLKRVCPKAKCDPYAPSTSAARL